MVASILAAFGLQLAEQLNWRNYQTQTIIDLRLLTTMDKWLDIREQLDRTVIWITQFVRACGQTMLTQLIWEPWAETRALLWT